MYGGFPKPAIQTRHRTPNSKREAWGRRSIPQTRKIRHRKKKNPPGKKTGGRWRQG